MVSDARPSGDVHGGARVAVLGTGSIGTRHLEVLRGIDRRLPIAVPKRSQRIRSQRINELREAGFSTARGLEEAIEMGANLCVIATETGSHVEDGLAALDQGLDLLVEKPLAVDTGEATLLYERAKMRGKHLFVACVCRFSESLNAFRRQLNEVGQIHSVRIECQSYLPDWQTGRPYLETFRARPQQGGVLLDLIHEIDYAGWIFGWPDSLQARVRNLGILGIDADEAVDLSWETSSGCVVSIRLDYLTKPARRRMTACGAQGTIQWDAIKDVVTLNLDGLPAQKTKTVEARNDTFAAQVGAFIDAIGGNADPRLAKGEEGVKALAVCDAARKSSHEKLEIPVEYP